MESHAQSVEDFLIEGLSFKLPQGASYVENRRSVSFFPQGGNSYSANGVKVIRIALTGDGWLDPSTVRIMYDLNNTTAIMIQNPAAPTDPLNLIPSGKILRTISGPWSFIRRMRLLAGGTVIEDIDNYNRTHEQFHNLVSKDKYINDTVEGFGTAADITRIRNVDPDGAFPQNAQNYFGISPGRAKTALFKPLSGLFTQTKFIPLRYCPLVLEFELVNDATEPCIWTGTQTSTDATVFTWKNLSVEWLISQVQLKCDLVTLDNTLNNEYAEHLLSGKALPINYDTYISQMQTMSGQVFSCNVTRSLTRLKSVFITFDGVSSGENPVDGGIPLTGTEARKSFNDFYHPSGDWTEHFQDKDLEIQIQIGSKLYPEYPIKSISEAFTQLAKCLGINNSAFHGVNIRYFDYRSCKFIVGIDTEKILEAGFTGLNTKAGDLMTIKVKHGSAVDTTRLCTKMYITLHSDQILNIRDTGVEVFD